jgi:hypothetical protein
LAACNYSPTERKDAAVKPTLSILVLLALLLGGPGQARADLIVNGSFEIPSTSFFTILPPIPAGFGWTIPAGDVDVDLTLAAFGDSAVDGVQNLDLDGTVPGTLQQTFPTTPGQTYALSFAFSNNPFGTIGSARVDVLGNTTLLSATVSHSNAGFGPGGLNWLTFNGLFVADSPFTTLRFTSLDASNSSTGLLLDAVSVNAVPEPTTLALFAFGGLGAVGHRLWRRGR